MNARQSPTVFLTLVNSMTQQREARLLIDSIRSFGGTLSEARTWVFVANRAATPCDVLAGPGVEILPLTIPSPARRNWFGGKVAACAMAEALAGPEVQSLVWLAPDCLILQPPHLLALSQDHDVALRPVHISNVGLPAAATPDPFWAGVYAAVGGADAALTIESFVDGRTLHAYFNTHLVAVNPSLGLFSRWLNRFEKLMSDQEFQQGPCRDEPHQTFLHQAVLSTLIATAVSPERLRILPADYSYPYNLQDQVPADRRACSFAELTCLTYEGRSLDPRLIEDIAVPEPWLSWLEARLRI
jgi:hypothetical protein